MPSPWRAAGRLAAATGGRVIGCAFLSLDDDGPRADAAFDQTYRPDQVLVDGEAIAGPDWTLTALATPGHTSNHLCLALEQSEAESAAQASDAAELIEVHWIPLSEACRRALSGDLNDGKTALGLLRAQARLAAGNETTDRG